MDSANSGLVRVGMCQGTHAKSPAEAGLLTRIAFGFWGLHVMRSMAEEQPQQNDHRDRHA